MSAHESLLVRELRVTALRDPGEAADWAQRLTRSSQPRSWSQVMIDVHLLRVEALVQAGRVGEAVLASVEAARVAGEAGPGEWTRLITALMVGSDLAVLAGYPHSVTACDSTRHTFGYAKRPDLVRETVTAALHAVAVFHHVDAGHGRWLLEGVARECAGSPALWSLLTRAVQAMNLSGEGRLPRAVPPPMPGGLLCPSLSAAGAGWLASRVQAHHAFVSVVA